MIKKYVRTVSIDGKLSKVYHKLADYDETVCGMQTFSQDKYTDKRPHIKLCGNCERVK